MARSDTDKALGLALYVMFAAALGVLLVNVAVFLVSVDSLPDAPHGSMLFAVGFSTVHLMRIRIGNRYRVALGLVLALTAAGASTLVVSPVRHVTLAGQWPASIPVWGVVELVGLFVFYSAMGWLCEAFELPWARARWRTAKVLLLSLLLGLLFDAFKDASFLAIVRTSTDWTGLPLEVLIYPVFTVLPVSYGIAAMVRTKRDLHASERETTTHRQPTGSWRVLADEALVLVLVGNTVWPVGLLLHSVWLFDAGAVAVVMGFGLKAHAETHPAADIPRTVPGWIRSAWRQAATLLILFIAVFVVQPFPNSILIALLVVGCSFTVTVNLDLSLFSGPVDQGDTESSQQNRPRLGQSRPLGITLMAIGWIESIAGLAMALLILYQWGIFTAPDFTAINWQEFPRWGSDIDRQQFFRQCIQLLAGSVLICVGQRFRWYARQHLSMIVSAPTQGESFVLYLRPFQDDLRRAELEAAPRLRGVMAPFLWLHELLSSGLSEEEQLVAALERGRLGRVIAVGAPGEWRPPGGAVRMYLPHDDWQEAVREMMSRARLVVIALGSGAGTMWELVEAMRIVPPERLLLVVPMLEPEYQKFREQATTELRGRAEALRRDTGEHWSPPELPDYPRHRTKRKMLGGLQALIYFRANWEQVGFALGEARLPTFHDTVSLPLRAGLYPVFGNLAAYERGDHRNHNKAAVLLGINGGWMQGVALTIYLLTFGSWAVFLGFDRKTEWLDLPLWLQALLVLSAPWFTNYGRVLRFRADYHLAYLRHTDTQRSQNASAANPTR